MNSLILFKLKVYCFCCPMLFRLILLLIFKFDLVFLIGLRTFLDCKEVKALVSIGCCYNLLSEQCLENTSSKCGFPLSTGAELSPLPLGKNARDLACQVFTLDLR